MNDESNPPEPPEATTDFIPSVSTPEPVVRTLGRFQLRQEIGRGAFGIVFRAYDPILDREVALKVPKFAADRSDLRERFLREAKAAARLRHPHIVTVHDFGSDGDQLYIAFELVAGNPLSEYMTTERPGYRQIAQWVRDLALALHHAHEQGVLHRDVKPANILIDSSRRCRLTDFGLSKDVVIPPQAEGLVGAGAALTREGVATGTPAYMAPEQARGDTAAVGPRADQYGLGVVLYELLTGRRPYDGTTERVIAQAADRQVEPKRPREYDPDIPYRLEAIAWKALRKNLGDRYADMSLMAVELQRWLRDEAAAADRQESAASGEPTPTPLEHPVWYPTGLGFYAFLLAAWLLPPFLCSAAALGYIDARHRSLDDAHRLRADRWAGGIAHENRIGEKLNYQPGIVECLSNGVRLLPKARDVINEMSGYRVNGETVFPLGRLLAGVAVYLVALPALWLYGRLRHRLREREIELAQFARRGNPVEALACAACGGLCSPLHVKCLHCGAVLHSA